MTTMAIRLTHSQNQRMNGKKNVSSDMTATAEQIEYSMVLVG